jgi:hypothetical protein
MVDSDDRFMLINLAPVTAGFMTTPFVKYPEVTLLTVREALGFYVNFSNQFEVRNPELSKRAVVLNDFIDSLRRVGAARW